MASQAEDMKGESPYWCWTLWSNGPVGPDQPRVYERSYPDQLSTYSSFGGRGKTEVKVLYTHAQEEMAPTTGNVHLQGYVEFDRRVKKTTLLKIFSNRISWELRRGTAAQADDYCGKEDSRVPGGLTWKLGQRSQIKGPGQRSDLEAVAQAIKSGKKRKEIAEEHTSTFMKYFKGIEAAAEALEMDLEEKLPTYINRTNYIFFGVSGSGKSTMAEQIMDGDTVYRPQKNNASVYSFENYRGQKWIFFDDFEPTMLNKGTLKDMMDNRKCTLPGRGSNSGKIGKHTGVIITSNIDPEEWYDKADATYKVHWDAIRRRSFQIWQCGSLTNGDPTEDWMSMGGSDKDHPAGYVLKSPLEDLIEWAKNKQAEEEAAALDASARISTGPPNSSVAAAASANADSLDASREYSELSQASWSQGSQEDPIDLR